MRFLRPTGVALGLFAVLVSCSSDRTSGTRFTRFQGSANLATTVRISEIHYDNTGTDAGEAVEVSFPVGTSTTGWSIVLYNGSGGAVYDTDALTGLGQTTCPDGERFVVALTYPANGIQNGSPDGIALVRPDGTLEEFLSYEGTFAGVGGAANGVTSVDIGRTESGSEPLGLSLQRSGSGPNVWSAPAANTFPGTAAPCNYADQAAPVVDHVTISPTTATIIEGATQQFTATAFDAANQPISGTAFTWASSLSATATVDAAGLATGVNSGDTEIRASANGIFGIAALHVDEPPPEPPAEDVHIVEIHYDNAGADAGEAFEIEGFAGQSLAGWSVVLYNQTGGVQYGTINLSGTIPDQCAGRGTLQFAAVGLQNGLADGLALVKPGSVVKEFLSYEGTLTATNGPAAGMLSVDIGVDEDGDEPVGRSLQKDAAGWYGPVAASFGACNVRPPTPPSFIRITGRATGDPALPLGYQDQLFGDLINGNGDEEPTTITWSSDTPEIATIDATTGVMTALTVGSAIMRATAANGTTTPITLPTRIPVAGGALYANHTEFGTPTDADASDDFILSRAEFTSSFNKNRGIPNWVSFNIEATHYGPEDRCECFTFDPLLPPETFTPYTTADYTGAGTFHGYGIDRGHLARSFDRTSGSLDNAHSFLFSNIIPQAADNNQGPWAIMENDMGNLARVDNKELFVIAGASGSKGTVKNEGKMTIPATTWKVVVILPRDQGLANVDSFDDLEVIAVIMPNDPGIRNVPWETYKTTVDAVEALSGYDLLKLLPDQVEIAVESNTRPPTSSVDGPYASNEGASVSMNGAATDPDAGDVLTYAWDFGDGASASGLTTSHTFAQNGSYTVTFTATDSRGLISTATTTASVANVAPTITSFSGLASVVSGNTYSASGTFSDPGLNDAPWGYSFGWGEGSPSNGSVSSQAIIVGASHRYLRAGTYTVQLTVTDRDGGSDARSITVSVARLEVPGEIDGDRFRLRDQHLTGSFVVLSTTGFDARTIVTATARIGSVGVAKDKKGNFASKVKDENHDGRPDLILEFSIRDLILSGALNLMTRELALTADLTDGRQIVSRAPLRPLFASH